MKTLYLIYPKRRGTIAPEIYGHFSEHIGGVFYDGLFVGKDSDVPNVNGFRKEIIEKFKAINPPVLRWPGGCYAEVYDWRDGIGEERPTRINWWTYWDGRYEPNVVGTHEFMDFCELVGAKAYFAANLTSMTPMHIRNWMDYCLSPRGSTTLALERERNGHPEPFDIPFWGVGNENWGGGGNMRPEFYADECRRYATVMNNAFPNVELFACGQNSDDYSWIHGVVPNLLDNTTGFAMHYYCSYLGTEAINYTDDEWDVIINNAKKMQDIIDRSWSIICAHGKQDKIKLVIDEWGCWHKEGSGPTEGYNLFEQQSTIRDAAVTALTLNIFNNNCEKIRMANVAQLCNNLHALFLASGENCIVTPTYHVFDMYQGHKGAEAIETVISGTDADAEVSVSASVKDGRMLITAANLSSTEDATLMLEGVGVKLSTCGRATLLYDEDMRAHNTFDNPERVMPTVHPIDLTKPYMLPRTAIVAIEVDILE